MLVPLGIAVVWLGERASDGEWSTAIKLRMARDQWLKAGSPDPALSLKYLGWSPSATSFVYTATQNIAGHTYHGLFAIRDQSLPERSFAITRDGEVLILADSGVISLIEDSGRVRKLKP
jgi:hypothetical protein